MKAMKACKDCAHVATNDHGDVFCMHEQSFRFLPDYYNGEERPIPRGIGIMRSFGECKKEALLFEPANRGQREP